MGCREGEHREHGTLARGAEGDGLVARPHLHRAEQPYVHALMLVIERLPRASRGGLP